ncbi:MAG TPA: CDP-diacylglycerol--serine O-phosphatidyltransferase [Candidatus Binatia bacterium]|nr:CDP-diacylglycerol--serine O-phosphatidyltransferase [Candidatus Binatia bacterium]
MLPTRGAGRLPLHKGVYVLPNLFTTGGLFLGVYSIIASSRGDFLTAALCIVVAHVCDGLDGRIARLTNTTSQFGVEYDSLADLVAFGVAPGLMVYLWGLQTWGHWGWLAACLFVACGALRLARFNVQSSYASKRNFVGLPIPAAADMIAATVLLYYFLGGDGPTAQRVPVLILVYALALLMVSNVPYYSFKDLDPRAHQPFYALVAIILVVKFVVAEPQMMLFGAAVAYVCSGPISLATSLLRRQRRRVARRKRREAAEEMRGVGG